MRTILTILVTGGATAFFFASPATGDCSSLRSQRPALAATIALEYEDEALREIVGEAVDLWRQCDNYATDFPAFVIGSEGTRTVSVEYVNASSGSERCGSFRGSTIILYRAAKARGGKLTPCGELSQNLAHELGHVLGLLDSPRGNCSDHIMAPLTPRHRYDRRVSGGECAAAGRKWTTFAERDWLTSQERPTRVAP